MLSSKKASSLPPGAGARLKGSASCARLGKRENPMDIGPSGIFPTALKAVLSDCNADGYVLIPVIPYAVIDIWQRVGVPIQKILGNWLELRAAAREAGGPGSARRKGLARPAQGFGRRCDRRVNSPEAAAKALAALAADLSTAKCGLKMDADL